MLFLLLQRMAPSQSMAPVLKRARFNIEDPASSVPRPLPAVRAARFSAQSVQSGEQKLLPSKLRAASPFQFGSGCFLPSVVPGRLGQTTLAGTAYSGLSVPQTWRGTLSGTSGVSMEVLESQDRLKLAQCWVGQAKGLAKDSAVFLGWMAAFVTMICYACFWMGPHLPPSDICLVGGRGLPFACA